MSGPTTSYDYLCIDAFIADMVGARALSSAFETGVIDQLIKNQPCTHAELLAALKPTPFDAPGLAMLLAMLRANNVVAVDESEFRLSAAFIKALTYRDLLEAKLYFANLVAPDFLFLLTALLVEPHKFMEHARLFKLFSYDRCLEPSPENYEQTARWMRLTTALTKYEAQACIAAYDFSPHRRMLDIGGNSGEFVLRVCKTHPKLSASVYDLPVVCDIGAKHIEREPEAVRISFIKRDPDNIALPTGYDLISFKSMLHDWPESETLGFLTRAHAALTPGGKLMIFERRDMLTTLAENAAQIPYGQLPLMLFFRSYREPAVYAQHLADLGFHDIRIDTVNLDMPFSLITAIK